MPREFDYPQLRDSTSSRRRRRLTREKSRASTADADRAEERSLAATCRLGGLQLSGLGSLTPSRNVTSAVNLRFPRSQEVQEADATISKGLLHAEQDAVIGRSLRRAAGHSVAQAGELGRRARRCCYSREHRRSAGR